MAGTLDRDATIRDVIGTLRDAEGYFCGVLERMTEWRRQRGTDGIVSIGTTGRGVNPHYRISHSLMDDGFDLLAPCYDGRTHAPFPRRVRAMNDVTWSVGFMSEDEVKALLGEVRSLKRPSRKLP